jgi:hypothetical protein
MFNATEAAEVEVSPCMGHFMGSAFERLSAFDARAPSL